MERRFTDQQVAEIIRRACEAKADPLPAAAVPTVSEADVRRIAAELGIGDADIERALADAGAYRKLDTGGLRSFSRTLSRTYDGSLGEEGQAAVLAEFVPYDGPSAVVAMGKSLSYTSSVGMAQAQVSLLPEGGNTVLRVRSSAIFAALATWLPALFLSAIASALIWDKVHAPDLVRAWLNWGLLAACWGTAWLSFRAMVRKTNAKILDLVENVSRRVCNRPPAVSPIDARASSADVEAAELRLTT